MDEVKDGVILGTTDESSDGATFVLIDSLVLGITEGVKYWQ